VIKVTANSEVLASMLYKNWQKGSYFVRLGKKAKKYFIFAGGLNCSKNVIPIKASWHGYDIESLSDKRQVAVDQ